VREYCDDFDNKNNLKDGFGETAAWQLLNYRRCP
jgi:hypothetical protein